MSSSDLLNKQIAVILEELNFLRKTLNLPLKDFSSCSTESTTIKAESNGNQTDSFKVDVSKELNLQVVPVIDEKAVNAALPYDDNFYLTFGANGVMYLRKKNKSKSRKRSYIYPF